ncbi:hypothetical protein C2W64_04415 [Brevibacillus laterosporus]|nr:energy-coupled thiamine transporter ThiT [Brevibacillus laterosporus]RAP28829.1 hypothetical protein C2W64_04415 [Brevibacillus laterosporus]
MSRTRLVIMMEIAIMAAIAVILSKVKLFAMPQGGSVSLVMVPIALLAFRSGWVAGIITGGLVGMVKFFFGGEMVHPIQMVLDYPLSYAVLGFGAFLYASKTHNKATKIASIWGGLLVGIALCLAIRTTSGAVWFGSYAPEGTPATLYSLIYNATYLVPEYVITALVMTLLANGAPQLFQQNAGAYRRI